MSKKQNKKLLTAEILKQALIGSVKKLDPRYMSRNPVMFVVEIGFLITLLLTIVPGLFGEGDTGVLRLWQQFHLQEKSQDLEKGFNWYDTF